MAANNVDVLSLGKMLQIAFSEGVRNQMSKDYSDWEMISMNKTDISLAREYRFAFYNSLNPASVQSRDPGTANRTFPKGFQPAFSENIAKMKVMNSTIEISYDIWDRARKSPEKYSDPLADMIQITLDSTKRFLAAKTYEDGTGVLGTVSSAAVTSPASDQLVFTLQSSNTARGHEGLFEYSDIVMIKASAGSASALDTSLATEPVYWKVIDKDRVNHTVTLQGLNSSYASAGTITAISVQPTSGDVFYKFGQQIIPDLTAPIADYGMVSDQIAGLESLAANDGRIIHGITMNSSAGGTLQDCGGNPLDITYLQKGLDATKIRVGKGKYKYSKMLMAPEANAALIESREQDRRFVTMEDATRGTKQFGYQHDRDFVASETSEYVRQNRLWVLPEGKADGKKVIEYGGSDFETVKGPKGEDFQLQISGGEYINNIVSFMQGYGVIIVNQPAALLKLHNFTVS